MSLADLYTVVSANLAGVVVLVIVMAYLSWRGVIVSGQRFHEMQQDRNYWRDLALRTIDDLEPRLLRLAGDVKAPPTSENDEVTS